MERFFEIDGDALIIRLSGEIDHHVSTELRRDIDAEIELFDMIHLIFDFSDVTFMDSSGIGMILGRYKKVAPLGGSVTIRNANRLVKQILDMSGVFTLASCEDFPEDTGGGNDGKKLCEI